MKGAPPIPLAKLDAISVTVQAVDAAGRAADQRWGTGRLSTLVPIEVGEKFALQRRKFSAAVWERETEDVKRHGEAMLRAYAKLDEMAVAAGHDPAPPDQWEFQARGELVVLVRDIADVGRVQLNGRAAQVWSLDEIANVITAHPILAVAKNHFPGATVESVRPDPVMIGELNDEIPF